MDSVQSGVVHGPLRRQFRLSEWDAQYQEYASDAEDTRVYEAGKLLFGKLDSIRRSLKVTFAVQLSASTKVRSFVALANQEVIVLRGLTLSAIESVARATTLPLISDLANAKIRLPIGANYAPDEVLQSIVDGVQLPLKVVLEPSPDLSGNPSIGVVPWQDIGWDLNLGNFYVFAEELWDDCLWNGYAPSEIEGGYRFAPADLFWEQSRTASLARQQNLTMQFFGIWDTHVRRWATQKPANRPSVREVADVVRDGRRQQVSFRSAAETIETGRMLDAARAYASEPYYGSLLAVAQPALGGGTLEDLLRGWCVVSSLCKALRIKVASRERLELPDRSVWLAECAPAIQKDALIRMLQDGACLTFAHSKAVVEFLAFNGKGGQELWAQPLVPVGPGTFSIIFGAAESPNLRRLVDVWLRQLGVEMDRRGPAFEDFVRTEIARQIASSRLVSVSKCMGQSFKFRPRGVREEEIDVVLVVGNRVLLGEAKCSVFPTESKQYAMHRHLVIEATQQIKRKCDAVEARRDEFRVQLRDRGLEVPEDFKVVPAVILNFAVHCCTSVDAVPVIDLHVLETFFAGELIDFAEMDSDRGLEAMAKRVFYADVDEAVDRLESFMLSPPQMEVFRRGLSERWVPIPAISDGDWPAVYLKVECQPVPDQAVLELLRGQQDNASGGLDVVGAA